MDYSDWMTQIMKRKGLSDVHNDNIKRLHTLSLKSDNQSGDDGDNDGNKKDNNVLIPSFLIKPIFIPLLPFQVAKGKELVLFTPNTYDASKFDDSSNESTSYNDDNKMDID